tara:strand:- start:75 stop:377 length:303 start_codon:yes stop_codon:yes gene_type:complete
LIRDGRERFKRTPLSLPPRGSGERLGDRKSSTSEVLIQGSTGMGQQQWSCVLGFGAQAAEFPPGSQKWCPFHVPGEQHASKPRVGGQSAALNVCSRTPAE